MKLLPGLFAALSLGSKVTQRIKVGPEEVLAFANLTGDTNPVHFGENGIVHGVLLNGFVSAVLGTKLPGPGYVVVEQSMKFPRPCRLGEEVEISVEVIEARKIITCRFECVCISERSVVHEGIVRMIKRKSAAEQS